MNRTSSTQNVPAVLPGRALDIVYLATTRLGLTPYTIATRHTRQSQCERIDLSLCGGADEATARAVFAALGAPAPVLGARFGTGQRLAELTGPVPALATTLSILVSDLPSLPATAADADVAALAAEVDAARATADAHSGPAPAPSDAGPSPVEVLRSGGERPVRFEARFASTCPACQKPLGEGEPASWLDGEAVHDTCAEAAGITVSGPSTW